MDSEQNQNTPKLAGDVLKFPYESSKPRLERYHFNDELFQGAHFDAFKLRVNSEHYNKDYSKLKYVAGNFAGLISKVCADMLFSEPLKARMSDKPAQEWLDQLMWQNGLNTQFYESALANSRHGDAVFKLRTGYLNPGDSQMTVIIEDITPSIYFPQVNDGNVRAKPGVEELCWIVNISGKRYLRKEIHRPGEITNELFILEKETIKQQVSIDLLNEPGLTDGISTGVDKSLLVHVPNWRDGSRFFGYDDYSDLTSLFFALNNRLSKNENILDKHSDPILALPEGVLDEKGEVKKEAFHMFEVPNEGGGALTKPEYIVWNANLEAAFKQIEGIVDFLYMFSETSPDAFGMNKNGAADSGRALKLRLMRTIAKVARKRLYYDRAIKDVLHTAMLLAQAQGLGVYDDKTASYSMKLASPEMPTLEWQDGLPIDTMEAAQEEQLRLESGNTSVVDSIMRLDHVDREEADEKAKAINDETSIPMPTSNPNIPPALNPPTLGEPSVPKA